MGNDQYALKISEPPMLAKQLGYAGLLPFITLAAMLWIVRADLRDAVTLALTGYGAVIASFLGGVHWGIAQRLSAEAARFHTWWGVAVSLLAWVALIVPADVRLPLLGLVLLACYVVDRRSYPRVGLAAWLPLRLHLTIVAVLSCALGALGAARVIAQ